MAIITVRVPKPYANILEEIPKSQRSAYVVGEFERLMGIYRKDYTLDIMVTGWLNSKAYARFKEEKTEKVKINLSIPADTVGRMYTEDCTISQVINMLMFMVAAYKEYGDDAEKGLRKIFDKMVYFFKGDKGL